MSEKDKNIKLPRFARKLVSDRVRCRKCCTHVREVDINFVGAGRDTDDNIYFAYEWTCCECNRDNRVIDTTHQFADTDWWDELGRMHRQAYEEMGPYNPNNAQPNAVARMLVGPTPLNIVYLLRGYRGEVGPIILFGYGFWNGWGSCRLETKDRIRVTNFSGTDDMTFKQWEKLAKLPEGSPFTHKGREWTRMTRAEIQELVRDRVFSFIEPAKNKAVQYRKATGKSTKQVERSYESAHTQKSSKGSRRASRNAGKVDSRRRRPEGLH